MSSPSPVQKDTTETTDANTFSILLLNGPNLNLLGTREPEIYGSASLDDIVGDLVSYGWNVDCKVTAVQSNSEGALIEALHDARHWADGVIINSGAYSHTSIALRDAIAAIEIPTIEVHISNVHKREEFRHVMLTAGSCVGVISGLGANSYRLALDGLVHLLR